jgi:ribose transport system substrate-binding protein
MSKSTSRSRWYDEENAPNFVARRGFMKSAAATAAIPSLAGAGLLAAGSQTAAADAHSGGFSIPDYDKIIRAKANGRTLKIGFTPPVLSEFFDEIEHACFRKCHEYTERFGVNWSWHRAAPTGDFDTVEEHFGLIENWVTAGMDAIIICTAGDFKAMQKVFTGAREKGCKIIQLNMPMELWPIDDVTSDTAVGYNNNLQAGYIAGEYIAKQLGGIGKMLQVWGPGGHWAESRHNGLMDSLKNHPGLEVVGKADGGYVRDKGFQAAMNLLTANPNVNAVYGENEEMGLGASLAISSLGLKHWDGTDGIVTIGADGLVSGYQEIRDGRLTATIDVGTVDQGLESVRMAFELCVLEHTVGRLHNQPTKVVDKTNVEYADAYVKWALGAEKISG